MKVWRNFEEEKNNLIVIVKIMILPTYCDDPDKEYCVPEKDDQHRQLHHPKVQELFLFGKETILEYVYFDIR